MTEFDLLGALRAHDTTHTALTDGRSWELTYGELPAAIERSAAALAACRRATPGEDATVVALLADNGPAWSLVSLAAACSRCVLLPLPGFFTATQLAHALAQAGASLVVTDAPERFRAAGGRACGEVAGLAVLALRRRAARLPARTATITFTSGTTGEPKGVCLGAAELWATSAALREATGAGPADRHLAVLPLAVLLEEVGGLRRALLAGATTVLPPLAHVGLRGSSHLDAQRLAGALVEQNATSAILTPQMLAGLLQALEDGAPRPAGLRFVGVGGAPVPRPLLARAQRLGLPALEGYGLTEMGSVVALNRRDALRAGSVGKPLRHVEVRIAEDGEVLVRGPHHLGTLGGGGLPLRDGWLATGDLGALDDDGFLHITGRKKHVFITSFGRNVSPEWVERELLAHPAVAAAAVFGEGWPAPRAVLVAAEGRQAELADAVAAANARLPDYARVAAFVAADAPFAPRNGLATDNGRPRRAAIFAAHAARLCPSPVAIVPEPAQ